MKPDHHRRLAETSIGVGDSADADDDYEKGGSSRSIAVAVVERLLV